MKQLKQVALVVIAVTMASAGAAQAQRMQMMGAGPGTNVFTVGSAIASVATQKGGMDITMTTMAGPQVIVPQLNEGKGDFTIMNGADAYQALNGVEPFYKDKHPNLRLVSVGYYNDLGILVRADSDIRTAADIKGKRVSGAFTAHKTCFDLASAQLANLGLSWDDVKVVPMAHSRDAAPALGDGRVDVALCVPVGQAVVKEVNARTPVRFLSMQPGEEATMRARKHYPVGVVYKVPKGESEGVLEDTWVWHYPFYLVTHKGAPDEAVKQITKVIHTNMPELLKISRHFQSWDLKEMASADVTIPYHPGAIAFYKEIGAWTPKMEEAQKKHLAHAQGLAK